MKITYAFPDLIPFYLTIANFFSKLDDATKAFLKKKTRFVFYLIVLMGMPALITGQVPQKDKSQTLTIEYVALIDLLEDGEQYEIEMITSGCFEQSTETLTISRKGDSYIALLHAEQVLLNQNQIQSIRDFEIDLRNIESGACTTIETYILKFRSENLQFADASCTHWFGKELKKKLGY